jgi:hypothetical protein
MGIQEYVECEDGKDPEALLDPKEIKVTLVLSVLVVFRV